MEVISDRYEIIALIGEGGMANVYLANDRLANRQVAIKILRGEMASDAVALVRFQREANAAATLTHPNIIQIYDVGNDNNRHYIVMEYVKGRTLKQWLAARGALPVNEAVYVMRQITLGIQAAHEKGIIHRDIKPQNVLVTDDGSIKITDFGIAMAQDALQLTVSDSVMGSVHYLAPELAKGEPATFRSDIYSLGIVFYELLSGDVPYRADAPVQVALKHLREEMPLIRDLNPAIPQFIENIVIKATAKNKTNRYASCAELLYDLDRSEQVVTNERLNFTGNDAGGEKTRATPVINKKEAKKMEKRKKKNDYYDDEEGEGKISIFRVFIGILLALVAVAAVGAVLYISGVIRPPKQMVIVPDMVNMTFEEAKVELETLGIYAETKVVYELCEPEEGIEKDHVISTNPVAGTEVEVGSTVKFVVSLGIWQYMDDFMGMNIEVAKQELVNSQLYNVNVMVQTKVDPKYAEGTIIEQTGLTPGFKIDPNKQYQVTFVVTGFAKGAIPGVLGLSVKDAEDRLKNLGFKVKKTRMPIPIDDVTGDPKPVQKDVVFKVDPDVGQQYTQTEKSYVTIYYYSDSE